MWLTSFMSKNTKDTSSVSIGSINSSKKGLVGVNASQSHLGIPLITPSGIACVPKNGEDAVVAFSDLGEICMGVVSKHHKDLQEGEIKIYTKAASVTLKNDGRILLEGKVYINGKEVS